MKLEDFENKHVGEACALLGNGLTLALYDLSKVDALLFGINRSWIDPTKDYPHARPEQSHYHCAMDIQHAEEFDDGFWSTQVFFQRHIGALIQARIIRRKMHKLGFDLIDGQIKFYKKDPRGHAMTTSYPRQRKRFGEIASELPDGVHVYNCNPNSGISCFPTKVREDWLY